MAEWSFTTYARPCLVEERVLRGITVQGMCERVPGLYEQTLSLIERQLVSVGPARQRRIADVLQLPTDNLFREFSDEEVAVLRKKVESGNYQ